MRVAMPRWRKTAATVEPVVEDTDADSEEEIGRERREGFLSALERPGEPATVENGQHREGGHYPEEEAVGCAPRQRGTDSADRPRVEECVDEPTGEADHQRGEPRGVPGQARLAPPCPPELVGCSPPGGEG